MIPYITAPEIPWLPINFFALLVSCALIFGTAFCVYRGKQAGYSTFSTIEMTLYVAIPAYLGSHVLLIVMYYPEKILQDPLVLLGVNSGLGLSSIGGLMSGVLAFYLYLRMTGQVHKWRELGDIVIQGFIIAWIFGRTGCSIVHDHPGIHSDFFLAVQYPDGARHDLGLYELMYTLFVLVPVSFFIAKKGYPAGYQLATFCLLYGLYRLPTDYLRIIDTRYFGWTPAQYASVLLFVIAWLIYRNANKHARNPIGNPVGNPVTE